MTFNITNKARHGSAPASQGMYVYWSCVNEYLGKVIYQVMTADEKGEKLVEHTLPYQPLLNWHDWLSVPDTLSVLVNATITAEEAHSCNRGDAFGNPLVLVAIGLVDELVRLDVAVEVVRHEVVITVVAHGSHHGAKVLRVAKCALLNFLEYLFKVRVDGVGAVCVRMAEILNIFSQVSKQEDVAFSDFTGNLDLEETRVSS